MKIKLDKFLRQPPTTSSVDSRKWDSINTRHKTQHISNNSNIQGIEDKIAKL